MLKQVTDAGVKAVEIEAKIAHSWDRLAALVDDGTIPEDRLAYVARHEPDDDAPPILRAVWASQLARWCAKPKEIGVDWDALATNACKCGDTGWVEYDDADGNHVARPCERCNGAQYRRWGTCWSKGANHSCELCVRRRAPRTPADARKDDADDAQADVLDTL